LQREPGDFELNMFAAMWSEHISYKSSSKWIDELPRKGDSIRIPALAENAGVIDITDQYACIIKMESHNHPTAVNAGEASVAVANIFRDIIAMGARPHALLNIMRFGTPDNPEVVSHINKVISSLGSYINNFGTPVLGGEMLFGESYKLNPLMNLMAVGLVEKEKIITASFKNRGDRIFIIGGKTTGYGVHGAGFASRPFSREMNHLIPSAQLADPTIGKVLSDCISELNDQKVIGGMQDIGAGGVLCAASEMAFRGEMGVHIHIDKIPVANNDLAPIDILLSQSQDQMLIAVSANKVKALHDIADKWQLEVAEIGEVMPHGAIKIYEKENVLADLPVSSLVKGGGAPVYIRKLADSKKKTIRVAAEDVPYPDNIKALAKLLIQHPNIASRKHIYEQFDTMAGYACKGSFSPTDAGIIRLPEGKQILCLSVDGNQRFVLNDPRTGTMIAVAEAARNIVCSGGIPLAIANGQNFGDPSDLQVYSDFVESIKGIKEIAKQINVPVVAGNVSFNNVSRTDKGLNNVQPTPVIGMVGMMDNKENLTSVGFKSKGDMIYLLGESDNDISGSEYLATYHMIENSSPPILDLDTEINLQNITRELIERKMISSAHGISLGGLFVALLECCLPNGLGFDVTSPAEVRADAFLFGESQSRVLVSVSMKKDSEFLDFMIEKKFPFSALGHVTKQELRIDDQSYGFITDYIKLYEDALGSILDNDNK